jgi:hypothetical protein
MRILTHAMRMLTLCRDSGDSGAAPALRAALPHLNFVAAVTEGVCGYEEVREEDERLEEEEVELEVEDTARCSHFTCFTGTKLALLAQKENETTATALEHLEAHRCSLYLLSWYKKHKKMLTAEELRARSKAAVQVLKEGGNGLLGLAVRGGACLLTSDLFLLFTGEVC